MTDTPAPNHAAYLAKLAPIGAEIARALNAHHTTLQLPLIHDAYCALKTHIEADAAIAKETRMASESPPDAPHGRKRKRMVVDVYDSDSDTEDENRRTTCVSTTPFMQLLRNRDKTIVNLEYRRIQLETKVAQLESEMEAINEIIDMPTGGTPESRSE